MNRDEYDTDEIDDITRLSDREYLVLGSANLEDVSDELNLHLESVITTLSVVTALKNWIIYLSVTR